MNAFWLFLVKKREKKEFLMFIASANGVYSA